MGKKKQTAVEDLLIPPQDNRICGTICVCQMTLILSCVALVYLTVAIYVPAYKIVTSGIDPNPVMCITTRNEQFDVCNKTTCSEWCLSKGSGSCTQAFVHLRHNGSSIQFSNCTNVFVKHCTGLDTETANNFTCKLKSCYNITGIFNCTKGNCFDISEIFVCEFHHFGEMNKCKARRGHVACRELNGIFVCDDGHCLRIRPPYNCDRRCLNIPTYNKNVILLNGDYAYTGKCSVATNVETGVEVWKDVNNTNVLMTSCYNVTNLPGQGIINTLDCINGSLLTNKNLLHEMSNFSYLMYLHAHETELNSQIAPIDNDLTISNDSRLMINLEECVNTLRDDCKTFFKIYAKNGSDYNARARFPCYYSPIDTSFAVQHFDLEVEYQQFMIGFTVPVALFVISCTVLIICQRTVVVGDDSKMRFKCSIKDEDGNLNGAGGGSGEKNSDAL